ncbi:hypothetical protein HPT25_16800 [Bacillus sp. BRMEA1]|uniref:hypothetical protein n=1 Tax=Neobacillus endophyticus TaxID=2738405 RepID=UPI0015653B1B|nr:hypothetical protein [Neobacillus endophyticus]NRD79022.1 hypothetical protein [Neobacillus endophyticus]
MDNFRAEISKKLIMYKSVSGLMGVCIIILAAFNRSNQNNASDFSRGVQVGIFIGISLMVFYYIGKLRNTLKNEALLKKLYVEENDERKILIQQKTGRTTTIIVGFSIAIAIIIAGFYNIVVLITLLVTGFYLGVIKNIVKYYYNRKY